MSSTKHDSPDASAVAESAQSVDDSGPTGAEQTLEKESGDAAALSGAYLQMFRDEQEQAERDERDYQEFLRQPTYQAHLVEAFERFRTTPDFVEGQLVQWKPQMKNRRFPAYSAPAVVVGYVLNPPTVDEDGMPLSEQFDLVLGLLDGEQTFRTAEYPSKRFTLWSES